jgi:Domain of unknown function (DUF5134)
VINATGLRWILTALFTMLTGYGLWRTARPHLTPGANATWETRITHLVHAVMAAAMAAMVWPWGLRLPAAPQIAFFALATVWLLTGGLRPRRAVRERLRSLPHAVMAGAMAWMLAAMTGSTRGRAHGHGGSGTADMPGMTMPSTTSSGYSPMTLTGTVPRLAAGVLAGYFLLLALWWLARGFDAGREGRSGTGPEPYDLGCHAGMALGMAVMLVAMA